MKTSARHIWLAIFHMEKHRRASGSSASNLRSEKIAEFIQRQSFMEADTNIYLQIFWCSLSWRSIKQHIQHKGESEMFAKGKNINNNKGNKKTKRTLVARNIHTHLIWFNIHFKHLLSPDVHKPIWWYLLFLVENAKSLSKPLKAEQIVPAMMLKMFKY